MKRVFLGFALFVATLTFSGCAGPRAGEVVDVDTGAVAPQAPAERVYDPATYSYYWERNGERVSGKYE